MTKRKKSGSSKQRRQKKSWRSNGPVKAKKYLGQHFLKDESIAQKIAETLSFKGYRNVIEIGAGTGVLTKYLLQRDIDLIAMDLDGESVVYLNHSFPMEHPELLQRGGTFVVVEADFLKFDLSSLFNTQPFAITGNFPYNISTQIVFKLLEEKDRVPEFSGMFQKEVAQRICAGEGNKTYGILSVLTQAFYSAEYLFTVPPDVFDPPPKVESGVLRLIRKSDHTLGCDEKLFYKVVKAAFNQRRKTMRNSLKSFELSGDLKKDPIFDRRPDQLAVSDFILLVQKIYQDS